MITPGEFDPKHDRLGKIVQSAVGELLRNRVLSRVKASNRWSFITSKVTALSDACKKSRKTLPKRRTIRNKATERGRPSLASVQFRKGLDSAGFGFRGFEGKKCYELVGSVCKN